MRMRTIALTAALLLASLAFAEDKKPIEIGPAPDFAATLKSNKDSYTLDPAQATDAFKESLKAKGRKPAASKVDLTLTITNNTAAEKTIALGGDSSRIEFKLEGPGAVTVENMVPMTREFRMGQEIKIAPGKSHQIKIDSLSGGMRGVTQLSYFTEPGDYKLSATLIYNSADKQEKLASDTVTLKVVKAEEKK